MTLGSPIAGESVSVQIQGTSDIDLDDSVTLNIEINTLGIVMVQNPISLCDVLDTSDCLVPSGSFDLTHTFTVPPQTPVDVEMNVLVTVMSGSTTLGDYETKIEVTDSMKELHLQMLFGSWKQQHKVEYDSYEEHLRRFEIFSTNLRYIDNHNKLAKYDSDVKLAMNHLGDLTPEEFKQRLNPIVRSERQPILQRSNYFRTHDLSVPDSVDWVKEGKVSEVKNQGQCGSCWSFSVTGALEYAYAIKYGEMIELSEQQLVDCSGDYGNQGCDGGLMDSGFEYVKDHGLTTESNYAYRAKDGSCQADNYESVVKVTGYVDVQPNNEIELKKAVANQPLSIAIEADQMAFQFYSSGVLKKSKCGTNLDHGVLLVGYGEDNGTKFWKVKNSWGPKWGADGYILLERTDDESTEGTCGVATTASYPVLG
jgi:C1A family cysteine protease